MCPCVFPVDLGSISAIATTMLELHVGFWSAYLLPLVMFGVGFGVLVKGKNNYVIKPPQGGVIGDCFRALYIAMRNGLDLEQAKPTSGKRGIGKQLISWEDGFVDELRTALVACKVCRTTGPLPDCVLTISKGLSLLSDLLGRLLTDDEQLRLAR